jgi:hypothetical protein
VLPPQRRRTWILIAEVVEKRNWSAIGVGWDLLFRGFERLRSSPRGKWWSSGKGRAPSRACWRHEGYRDTPVAFHFFFDEVVARWA